MNSTKLLGPMDAKTGFRWIMYAVGALLAIIVAISYINAPDATPSPAEERFFSGYDGSHRELEKKIKASMNDPDSYEHVETRYRKQGDVLRVFTTFKGKNGFGGTITSTAEATISNIDGHVIDWQMSD